jgi:hypothetical protein
LVDECRDFLQITQHSDDVATATENARRTQEDSHRLGMPLKSSVVYRVDGRIDRWRVYSFSRDRSARLEFAVSSDGENYTPVKVRRNEFALADTVYGYLLPVLFQGNAPEGNARYLQLRVPATPTTDDKQGAPPWEIGRVEIEFDRASDDATSSARKSGARPTPMSATVFVDNPKHIEGTLATIDMAAARGDRRLNVAVTILVDLTKDFRIKNYGWSHGPERGYVACDEPMRQHFSDALRRVFARMVEHDMDIYILPHIDAGGRVRTWRNWVDFDPLSTYAGYSYEDLMIGSIADALAATIKPDTRVEMALSGEMGTSLFLFPQSYREVICALRNRSHLEQLRLGISLNHGGISGQGNPTGAENINLTEESRRQMQLLINESDFVGMSFYRPVNVPPAVDDFVRGIDHFMSEFAQHGLQVPTKMPLHFSEVGIGGGHDESAAADDPMKAAATPWAGSGDPRINPWRSESMQNLRRQYHRALLDFLATQPAEWNVSAAFFWSTGSWDPQGLRHPVFADPEIIEAIQQHNRAVHSSR